MALVLGRKAGEAVIIGGNIRVEVVKTEDGLLRLKIEAPKEVQIVREELISKAVNGSTAKNKHGGF